MSDRILAEGVRVSNDTRVTGLNNNDLIIGSSGSGKTGGYVIPNLQNISGSVVVSDTKGQLRKMFTPELEKKGYKVMCLDFVDQSRSCCWNPMKGIRRYEDGSYNEQDIKTLANNIVPILDVHEPFWEMAAQGYIEFLICYCLDALPPEEQNLISVCELHRTFISPGGELSFIEWVERHPDTISAKRYRLVKPVTAADRTWGCIIEFANRALTSFDFREARNIFGSADGFDPRSLGEEKTVLFLNVSDTDSAFDKVVNIFYTQALQLLCARADRNPEGRLRVPVRIIMDDFAASARIPDFGKIISVIRSRDISVSLVLQSMSQLNSMYSAAEATTIINNCDHLLYLGGQDLATADFMGRRIFKSPDSVLCKPLDKAILVTNGEKARFVDKIKPYSTLEEKSP